MKDLVNAAYKEKHNTPGSIQCVKDMSRKKSRDTTTGLALISGEHTNAISRKHGQET